MANQCNTCGGYEGIVQCAHCPTVICNFCKHNHQEFCELLQKAKKRGEGPTVANAGLPPHRAGHESPVEAISEYDKMWGRGVELIPAPPTQVYRRFKDDAPEVPVVTIQATQLDAVFAQKQVENQINAVKDLQNETSNPEEKTC